MSSRLALWVFLAVVGQAIAAPALTLSDECTESCPDDGPCPPACASCPCCAQSLRPAPLGVVAAAAAPPATRQALLRYLDPAPTVPEPRAIFHVPIPPRS